MESNTELTSRRLKELDGLRGVAAISVVLFHYTTRYQEIFGHKGAPIASFGFGYLGVELFFIISGFVILMSIGRANSLLDFAVSRFSRLYPAYWAAVILTFMVLTVSGLWPHQVVSIGEAVVNLTMLQSFLGVPSVEGVYWTLQIELVFYGLMALMFALRLLRHVEMVSTCLLLLAIAKWAVDRFPDSLPAFAVGLTSDALAIPTAFGRIEFFVTGMMLYLCWKNGLSVDRLGIICLAVATTAVTNGPMLGGVHAAFAIIVALSSSGRLSFLQLKPFVFLGFISYTLYLIHQYVGYVVIHRMESSGVDSTVSILLTLFLMLVLSLAVSLTVERPALALIRTWYKSLKSSLGAKRVEVVS